jgi:hypothetical protein
LILTVLLASLTAPARAQEPATPEEGEARLQAIREQIEKNKAEAPPRSARRSRA